MLPNCGNGGDTPRIGSRVLSGMRPTGRLHLGHWCGVLNNWRRLQESHECFFFVADWHALTTEYSAPGDLAAASREMALSWLAAGIDAEKSTLFVQSQVPQHAELLVLLSMICPLPWLLRLPTYKEQKENLRRDLDTHGFLGYPLLQSADILIYRADVVPVGEDQLAHIEFTREAARRFNHFYGRRELFSAAAALEKLPPATAKQLSELAARCQKNPDAREELSNAAAAAVSESRMSADDTAALRGHFLAEVLREPRSMLTQAPRLPGTDGRKMSKSYDNTIDLFDEPETIQNKIAKMQTDPARVRRHDVGDPDKCPVWPLHKTFSDDETREWVHAGCRSAAIGCLECKKKLSDGINLTLLEVRERRRRLEKSRLVDDILREGAKKARAAAECTLQDARRAMGLGE